MKFIHCSDFHLGAMPEAGRPWAEARANEIRETVRRIVSDCNANNIDLLLISGDLFHKQPLVRELRSLNELFETLNNTKVVFIAGSHDYLSPRSRYRDFKWCKNVTMLDGQERSEVYFYGLETTVYGFSYSSKEISAGLYRSAKPKNSPGIHIMLAHGSESTRAGADYDRLSEAGFDYVALGGSHSFKRFSDNMFFAGTPEPLDRSETGEHGYILGEFTHDGTGYQLSCSFVPVSARKYIDLHVRVSGDDNTSSIRNFITNEIIKNGAGNLYRIYLEGVRNAAVSFDKEAIMAKGMITEVVDETVLDYDYDKLVSGDGMISGFINRIRNVDKDESLKDRALFYGIDALLKSRKDG